MSSEAPQLPIVLEAVDESGATALAVGLAMPEALQQINPRSLNWGFIVERVTRIELAVSPWEAMALGRADSF